MPRIEIIGVYPVQAPEPVHLIELWVRGAQGIFRFGDITQETSGRPQDNWQVPYAEQILNPSGDAVAASEFHTEDHPELWQGDMRMVFFFHYLDPQRPIRTPFGEVRVPAPSAFPPRLSMIRYEPP